MFSVKAEAIGGGHEDEAGTYRQREHLVDVVLTAARRPPGGPAVRRTPHPAHMDVHEDRPTGKNRAFSNLNEGLGKVLRFGANSPEVIKRLQWMAHVLAPALAAALAKLGPMELKPLIAQALQMGDEVHNRNGFAEGRTVVCRFSRAP